MRCLYKQTINTYDYIKGEEIEENNSISPNAAVGNMEHKINTIPNSLIIPRAFIRSSGGWINAGRGTLVAGYNSCNIYGQQRVSFR